MRAGQAQPVSSSRRNILYVCATTATATCTGALYQRCCRLTSLSICMLGRGRSHCRIRLLPAGCRVVCRCANLATSRGNAHVDGEDVKAVYGRREPPTRATLQRKLYPAAPERRRSAAAAAAVDADGDDDAAGAAGTAGGRDARDGAGSRRQGKRAEAAADDEQGRWREDDGVAQEEEGGEEEAEGAEDEEEVRMAAMGGRTDLPLWAVTNSQTLKHSVHVTHTADCNMHAACVHVCPYSVPHTLSDSVTQ